MKIEMGKQYRTRDGRKVRVLCTDRKHSFYPVIALMPSKDGDFDQYGTYTSEGLFSDSDQESGYDLIEVSPYDDFKIDEPVMVRDYPADKWKRSHFAGVSDSGCPRTFAMGRSSWSSGCDPSYTLWNECRRPTKEELGEQ